MVWLGTRMLLIHYIPDTSKKGTIVDPQIKEKELEWEFLALLQGVNTDV